MAMTVLTDTQMSAVEYVLRKSKEASEKVYSKLLNKVLRLGFTEKDLERWDTLIFYVHCDQNRENHCPRVM